MTVVRATRRRMTLNAKDMSTTTTTQPSARNCRIISTATTSNLCAAARKKELRISISNQSHFLCRSVSLPLSSRVVDGAFPVVRCVHQVVKQKADGTLSSLLFISTTCSIISHHSQVGLPAQGRIVRRRFYGFNPHPPPEITAKN